MTRLALDRLRRGDYVWIARTWPWPVVYHYRRGSDAPPAELTLTLWVREHAQREEHTAEMAGWAFTICGLLICQPEWQPGWSDEWTPNRFAYGASIGAQLPLRLLDRDETRPCRRCFEVPA